VVSIIARLDGAITNPLQSFGTNHLLVLGDQVVLVTKWDSAVGFGGRSLEERLRKPLPCENAVATRERRPSGESVSPWLFAPWNMIHKAPTRAWTPSA
jgi:hypothetical protein